MSRRIALGVTPALLLALAGIGFASSAGVQAVATDFSCPSGTNAEKTQVLQGFFNDGGVGLTIIGTSVVPEALIEYHKQFAGTSLMLDTVTLDHVWDAVFDSSVGLTFVLKNSTISDISSVAYFSVKGEHLEINANVCLSPRSGSGAPCVRASYVSRCGR